MPVVFFSETVIPFVTVSLKDRAVGPRGVGRSKGLLENFLESLEMRRQRLVPSPNPLAVDGFHQRVIEIGDLALYTVLFHLRKFQQSKPSKTAYFDSFGMDGKAMAVKTVSDVKATLFQHEIRVVQSNFLCSLKKLVSYA